jgi:predicted MPP superfamily phosphohydrolase
VFGVVLTLAVSLMQVYVFGRAWSLPVVRRRLSRRQFLLAAVSTWSVVVLDRALNADTLGLAGTLLDVLAMVWPGTLFLTSCCLLAVDLVTAGGWLLTRWIPALRAVALMAGALLTGISLLQGFREPAITEYVVELSDLPATLDGTVIVALSDLHLGSLLGEDWLSGRVAQVQALRPDVVVVLGDVFEGHGAPAQELTGGLRRLSAPLGVWSVLGNHEFYGAGAGAPALFAAAGLRLLRNNWVALRPGLVLAGLEQPGDGIHSAASSSDSSHFADRPSGALILLSHAPPSSGQARASGADLVICGHTHGGQVWPFGYLVRQRFAMLAGEYHEGGTTVIVSRGTGFWGPPMRLWQRGEILRITLRRATAVLSR